MVNRTPLVGRLGPERAPHPTLGGRRADEQHQKKAGPRYSQLFHWILRPRKDL